MLSTKVRAGLAVLGAALTVTISTATVAPNAYASKNIGCNVACQRAISKHVVVATPCDNLHDAYNGNINDIGDYSLMGDYAASVNAAVNATKLYNAAKDDGCAWAA